MKHNERSKAIHLRRRGRTYAEILAQVPVAKSTLSLWLRSVGLAQRQKQRITKKRRAAGLRGADVRRTDRLAEIDAYLKKGRGIVGRLSDRELRLIGAALYWAEGSKQRDHTPSTAVIFANSDPKMHAVFLRYLRLCGVSNGDITFELYVHSTRSAHIPLFKRWWAHTLRIPVLHFKKVYLKRGRIQTNRHNTDDLYHGLLRIRVKGSTSLNREIHGWVEGIVASIWGVV